MNYYFITGTSRGLGKAIAERILKEKDQKVVGIGRDNKIFHPNYRHLHLDFKDVEALKTKLEDLFPSLLSADKVVLINNSGMLGDVKYVGRLDNQTIIDVLNVNTIAPAMLMNQFLKAYINLKAPKRIVNVSSGAGKSPIDGWSSYCTSKSALDMFSLVMESEQSHEQNDVKIYSVAPGVVDTKMQGEIRASSKDDFSMIDKFKDYKKEGALSSPEEVAEKYWYLLNNEKEFASCLLDVRNF